ncbi:MAG: hypothetical protein GTO63_25920, partial [Anaerolineae bacterium]|nr:hypothetical protein [Anaerolineae bacterium]NIN98180.1 hypothetical protein [Anaerolineae bacterium]NIQ81103.1 hypothetical protein [Anaerolineae bacterium]
MAFCQACYDKGEKFVVDEMYKYIVAERWHQICPAVRDSIGELRGFEATKEALVAEMDERMKKVPLSEPIHDIPLTGEVVILESHGVGIFFLPLKEEAL